MKFSKIKLCIVIGAILAAFGLGNLSGGSVSKSRDWQSDFELLSMQLSSISSRLAKNELPEAGDIYMLRLAAADLGAFYVHLGYEDLGASGSHKPTLTYLEESCFNIMTADLAHYTYEDWCAFLEKLEPLREVGQPVDNLTLEQALSQLDEALNPS